MGLLSKLFGGGSTDTSNEEALIAAEKKAADEEKARYNALKREQAEQRSQLKARSTSMQGGGRRGLMYGGNAQGVA